MEPNAAAANTPSVTAAPVTSVLDPAFVDLLACPACDERPPLRLEPRDGGQRLICDRCGRAYPVSPEGIPLLLPEEAENTRTPAS